MPPAPFSRPRTTATECLDMPELNFIFGVWENWKIANHVASRNGNARFAFLISTRSSRFNLVPITGV